MNWLLALHLLALAIGTGMSLANLLNLRLSPRQAPDGAAALAMLRLTLGRVGDVVITLLWLSGLALLWRMMATGAQAGDLPPAFHAKMLLVVILTSCHAASRWAGLQALRHGRAQLLGVARACTLGVFLSSVGAILLAVATFR